jgi:hypothetical protein
VYEVAALPYLMPTKARYLPMLFQRVAEFTVDNRSSDILKDSSAPDGSGTDGRRRADKGGQDCLEDLIPFCANCHRMIHRGKPWLSIDDLTTIVTERRNPLSR